MMHVRIKHPTEGRFDVVLHTKPSDFEDKFRLHLTYLDWLVDQARKAAEGLDIAGACCAEETADEYLREKALFSLAITGLDERGAGQFIGHVASRLSTIQEYRAHAIKHSPNYIRQAGTA